MALEIIYGPYLDGVDEIVFSGMKNNLKNGSKVIYIVPEQASFDADKSVVLSLGEKFSHICETISFKRMVQMVNSHYSAQKNEYITEEIKDLILYNIIKKNSDSLKSLEKRTKGPDSIYIFKNIISELNTHLIDFNILENIKDKFESTPPLKDKINDLWLITKKYDEYLKNNFSGYEDAFRLLVKNIEKYGIYKDYEVYIDGFVHFSPSEFEIIKAIFRNCRNMHVSLLLDNPKEKEKGDLFYITYKTYEKLRGLSKQYECDFICSYADNSTDKKILDIFTNTNKKTIDNIISCDCKNYADEIRSAAYEIKKCINSGYSYSDISVLCSEPDSYASNIERIFKNSSIPFFMDKKIAVSKNPVCKFFMNVIRCMSDSCNYEDISCYIKSILFMTGNFDDISIFENYISSFRLKRKVFFCEEEWQKTYDVIKVKNQFYIQNEKTVEKIYKTYIVPLFESFSSLKKKNRTGVYTGCLKKYIKAVCFEEKFRKFADSLVDFNDKQLYINAYNTFIRGIKTIEIILDDEEITPEEYASVVSQMLEVYKIGSLPNTIDAVTVTDLERGRIKEKKIIFILGFNDGVTPKNACDTDYLSDIEREEIGRITDIILPSSSWKNNSSYLSLYRGMISYSDKLFISKSKYNMKGDSLAPSFMWNDIVTYASSSNEFKKAFVNVSEATKYAIENNFNAFMEKNENKELLKRVRDYNPELLKDIELMGEEGYFNPEKKIDKKLIDTLYQKKLNTSVSRLETYQKCAYSYFLRYLLKINSPEVGEYDFAKTGTIVHNVLNDFSVMMQKDSFEWEDVKEDYVEEKVEHLVRLQILNSFPDCNILSAKTRYLIKKISRISKTAIMYIKEHYTSGLFRPIGYEIPISPEGIQPLSFLLSDGSIMEIYGRIDRADIFVNEDDAVFVRIIDYKQSTKEIDFALVKEGIRIQLFVYLQSLIKNGGKYLDIANDILPGAAFYMAYGQKMHRFDDRPVEKEVESELKKRFFLNGIMLNDESVLYAIDKELEGSLGYHSDIADISTTKKGVISTKNLLYKTQFDMLLNECEELIKKVGNRIVDGEYYIKPYSKGDTTACDYCEYKSVCQFDKTMYPYKTVYSLGKNAFFDEGGDIDG